MIEDRTENLRRARPLSYLLMAGLLLATVMTAAEPQERVRWSFHAAPIATDWQPDPLSEAVVARALSSRRLADKAAAAPPLFTWPLRQSSEHADTGYWATVNFVDHDSRFPGFLLDYEGGQRTYDIPSGYNHQGLDLISWPFGWVKLALGQVEVVAAAAGTIVNRTDGNFDLECEAGFDEDRSANLVGVEHEDGSLALYAHLKTGSLTSKQVGDEVSQGEYLGLVGSSGFSGYPHLHFEVFGSAGNLIDPFAGPFNSLNDDSWWSDQRPYHDTQILTAMTHSAEPFGGQCRRHERTHVERRFAPGDDVYLVAYFRDLRRGQPMQFTISDPEGAVFDKGKLKSREASLPLAALMGELRLPEDAPAGTWTYSVKFQGDEITGSFEVGAFEPLRSVRAVTPGTVPSGVQRRLKIRGSGFTKDLVFDIQSPETTEKLIEIRRAKVKKSKVILTVFIAGAAAPGPRDLVITAPDYTQTVVENALRVLE